MAKTWLIVVGGSTGSTPALKRFLAGLPPGLPAAVLIATHLSDMVESRLADVLQVGSPWPVKAATDRMHIQPGTVYVAVPGRHLLVLDHAILLGTGPRENMARPAIDALFRSAAVVFGPGVVGVVLSGMLNDGASGLHAIKRCGGIAIVQHPVETEAPQMPLSALEAVDVDHVASAADMGSLIARLIQQDPDPPRPPPPDLELEVQVAIGRRLGSERLRSLAVPAPLTCPHCAGVLSETTDAGPLRFRCQVGHGFTAKALFEAQQERLDEAIMVAMRIVEERLELIDRMAAEARLHGRDALAALYCERGKEYGEYAATLRRAADASIDNPPTMGPGGAPGTGAGMR